MEKMTRNRLWWSLHVRHSSASQVIVADAVAAVDDDDAGENRKCYACPVMVSSCYGS
jgi:hypothetical protein